MSDPPSPEPTAADPRSRRPASRRTKIAAAGVAVVVLATAGWFGFRALTGPPVPLAVDGAPIVNAQQMLDDLTPQFRQIAAQDGAPLAARAGCWFAPPADAQTSAAARGPRVACGPVRLGIAGDDQFWLVTQPSYAGTGEVRGRVRDLDGVATIKRSTLNRPDGKRPPAEEPRIGADGVRADDGRLIANAGSFVDAASQAFANAARSGKASTAASTRCYLGVREVDRAGVPIRQSTGTAWCGPVRTRDSTPGQYWSAYPVSLGAGSSLVAVEARRPAITRVGPGTALPPGESLWRPDGQQPDPAAEADLEPPTADPQRPGFSDVLVDLAAPADLVTPGDGRLITPTLALNLTGLYRGNQVGAGDEALVAAEGEELVVAAYRAERTVGVNASSTATLVVDGNRRPFPAWSRVAAGSWLVVSVPQGAEQVGLEVLFDGRAQTISLLTGERAPGAPRALYRSLEPVGVGKPVSVRVALPEGDPAGVQLVVVDATLAAWFPGFGWAVADQAFISVGLAELKVDRPCCALAVRDVTPTFVLETEGADAVKPDERNTANGLRSAVVFAVADTVTEATLSVGAVASYDGGQRSGKPVDVALRFP